MSVLSIALLVACVILAVWVIRLKRECYEWEVNYKALVDYVDNHTTPKNRHCG